MSIVQDLARDISTLEQRRLDMERHLLGIIARTEALEYKLECANKQELESFREQWGDVASLKIEAYKIARI